MARGLEPQELLDIQIEGYDLLANKMQEFESKGKKPFRYDPYGSGIMPQDIFDDLRDPKDPDYKFKEDLIHHSDGHRKYPVNTLVMHHAVSDFMVNWSDLKVQDWFDRIGRGRGYKGVARSYHAHPRRNKETFSQAHYGAHIYTANKNKYGYRLTILMKDIFNNVAWHAGNWAINQRSLGAENAGNYVNRKLNNKQLMLYADTLRNHDRKVLKGNLKILCHNQISATACPGKICSQVPTLIDMFNNPAKWNAKLWPKPKVKVKPKPPAPKAKPVPKAKPPTPAIKIVKRYTRFANPKNMVINKIARLWDFNKLGWNLKIVKTFKKGEPFVAVGQAEHSNGGLYYMTNYSFGNADKTGKPTFTYGVNKVDLSIKPVTKPKTKPPAPPKPKTEPTPPTPPKPPEKPPQKPKEVKKREEVKSVSTKPGVKTTEFYLVLIPYALMILKTVFNIELDQEVIANGILGLISLVTTGFYIWSRVQVKLFQNSN